MSFDYGGLAKFTVESTMRGQWQPTKVESWIHPLYGKVNSPVRLCGTNSSHRPSV